MNNQPVVSTDAAKGAFMDAMRLFVGQGRRFTYAALEATSGVKQRNLYAYAEGASYPPVDALFSILKVMPPEFGDMVMAPTELNVARRLTEEECEAFEVVQACARATSEAAARAPGGFNHKERGDLKPIFREAVSKLNALLD